MTIETEIETNDYKVWYDEPEKTVRCKGSFRLNGVEEYAPIIQLLNYVADQQPPTLTLDLRELQFLNSSGINVISKFVISVRQRGNIALAVQGSKRIPWQGKSLQNLQKLMPKLQLSYVE
jgi:hypothetical protein